MAILLDNCHPSSYFIEQCRLHSIMEDLLHSVLDGHQEEHAACKS